MSSTVNELIEDALHFAEDQRLTLAHRLLESIEPPLSAEIDSAWQTEIRNRIADFRQGKIKSLPADEVFSALDRRLQ